MPNDGAPVCAERAKKRADVFHKDMRSAAKLTMDEAAAGVEKEDYLCWPTLAAHLQCLGLPPAHVQVFMLLLWKAGTDLTFRIHKDDIWKELNVTNQWVNRIMSELFANEILGCDSPKDRRVVIMFPVYEHLARGIKKFKQARSVRKKEG